MKDDPSQNNHYKFVILGWKFCCNSPYFDIMATAKQFITNKDELAFTYDH